MKKFTLLFSALLMVSFLALAQIKLVVYKSNGSKIELLASEVDSIGFKGIDVKPDDSYEDELEIPIVRAPGEGKTTIVLYIPESSCDEAIPYAIGSIPGDGSWVNQEELRMTRCEGYDDWWKVTVDALTEENATNFKFRMDDGMNSWSYEPKGSYELLEGADEYLSINVGKVTSWDEPNNLLAIADCDNQVLYVKSGEWSSTPCKELVPAGHAKFIFTLTGEDPGKDIYFTGNFAENAWTESNRVMTKQADGTYSWEGDYPENFRFKVIVKNVAGVGNAGDDGILWLEGADGVVERESGSVIRFEGCFSGLCPGDDDISDVVISEPTGYENGYGYVDLGLPSGTQWATYNVGAGSPEEYGDYFAWGEIEPKNNYDWSTYKWCNGSEYSLTKYCTDSYYGIVDNKTELELVDDAAYINWGGDWRMPTNVEQYELRTECIWTWGTLNGVKGYKVTSKSNGNSIFLPAAGYRHNSDLNGAGSSGYYWSSSLSTYNLKNADNLGFDSSGYLSVSGYYRNFGISVRPVLRLGTIYSIEFASNGGNGTMQSVDVQRNVAFTIPENIFTRSGYSFVGWNTKADGTGISYVKGDKITITSNITLYAQWISIYQETGTLNGHGYVDLGLPSGTMWATMNVGATSPEEYGNYYAWGETETKSSYTLDNYKWYDATNDTYTKYPKEKRNLVVNEPTMLGASSVPRVYLRGNGDWETLDREFTYVGDDIYEYTQPITLASDFKIGDAEWTTVNFGSAGEKAKVGTISLGEYGENIVVSRYIYATKITLDTYYGTLTIEGTLGEEITYSTWTICGVGELVGDNWDPSSTSNIMTESNGVFTLVKKGVELNPYFITDEGEVNETIGYGYKVVADGSWGYYNFPEVGNNFINVDVAGIYDVTFTWYPDSENLYATIKLVEEEKANLYVLELSDDAANANWGSDWRMPTKEDIEELINYCTMTLGTKNGVNGYIVTGSNGNSIFLPAAGYLEDNYLYDSEYYGSYWTSSLYMNYTTSAHLLYFDSNMNSATDYREYGLPIRPVFR